MVDNLEKPLSKTSISNQVSTMLHSLLITGQEVREVNNGSALGRRHFDLKVEETLKREPMVFIGNAIEFEQQIRRRTRRLYTFKQYSKYPIGTFIAWQKDIAV